MAALAPVGGLARTRIREHLMMLGIVAETLVGYGRSVALDKRLLAALGRDDRLPVLQPNIRNVNECQRLCAFLAQCVDACLHRRDLVWIRCSDVVLLRRVLGEVEQLNARGNGRTPNELPITLPHGTTE